MNSKKFYFFIKRSIPCDMTKALKGVFRAGTEKWNKIKKKKSSAALVKSGPLDFPSENIFLLYFAHEKASGHMFQK